MSTPGFVPPAPTWLGRQWLPETPLSAPEVLDELRAAHARVLDGWLAARGRLESLVGRLAAEDAAARGSLETAVRAGVAEQDPPAVTSPGRRAMEVQIAEEKIDGALLDVCEFVERAATVTLPGRIGELEAAFAELHGRGVYDRAAQAEAMKIQGLIIRLQSSTNVMTEIESTRADIAGRRQAVAA